MPADKTGNSDNLNFTTKVSHQVILFFEIVPIYIKYYCNQYSILFFFDPYWLPKLVLLQK